MTYVSVEHLNVSSGVLQRMTSTAQNATTSARLWVLSRRQPVVKKWLSLVHLPLVICSTMKEEEEEEEEEEEGVNHQSARSVGSSLGQRSMAGCAMAASWKRPRRILL